MTRARTLANLLTTSGRIVQVVQGVKSDTQSITANLATKDTVTGLNATITPTSSSSKVLVQLNMHVGASIDTHVAGLILRDTTEIGLADANGSRTRNSFACGLKATSADWCTAMLSQSVLDSPATTSATTYSVKLGGNGSATVTVNFDERNQGSTTDTSICMSSITLMEVLA
tara:strand:+ start:612 stop:1127 length:516 start_codon:yes stop_codon:yes gene_type:complete